MPIKFKESVTDRKGNTQNYYMQSTPTSELKEAMENRNVTPKLKQKITNELVRRSCAKSVRE